AARLHTLQLRVTCAVGDAGDAVFALFAAIGTSSIPDVTLRIVKYETKDWASGFRFVRTDGALHVEVFATAVPDNWETYIQEDILRGLDLVAALEPARVTLVRHRR